MNMQQETCTELRAGVLLDSLRPMERSDMTIGQIVYDKVTNYHKLIIDELTTEGTHVLFFGAKGTLYDISDKYVLKNHIRNNL